MSGDGTNTSPVDEWMEVLDGRPGADPDRVLGRGLAQLADVLDADPEVGGQVEELVRRRAADQVLTEDSWTAIDEGLTVLVGREPALLLAWLAMGDATRLDEVTRLGPPVAAAFLRSLMARYGPELRDAYEVWRRLPNDWRTFFRDVYHDQLLNQPFIRVRILKYNGDVVVFEGSPNSYLTLVRNLILTLQMVATPDGFGPEIIASFDEEARRLIKQIIPQDEAAGSGAAAAPAANPTP